MKSGCETLLKTMPIFSGYKSSESEILLNLHVRDALISGYESHISRLTLPDLDDRHVLAAAISCSADVILTFNLKHFPDDVLQAYGIMAQHPDEFLFDQLKLAPDIVCLAAKQQRNSLKNSPMDVKEYLASLERQGLPKFVLHLREYAEFVEK